MGYRIEVVVDDCMSSGKCVGDYPQAFGFDDEELATLLDGASTLSNEDMIRAARNCPSRAIQVYDESGTQIDT